MILLSSCQFNEETELPEYTKQVSKESSSQDNNSYILENGIYIINKNWDKQKLDNTLSSNPDFLLIDKKTKLIFITEDQDSIEISITKISRQNPIIIFNKSDGPILTSLDRLHIYLNYQRKAEETKESQNIIMPHLDSSNTVVIQKKDSRKIDDLASLSFIPGLKYDSIKVTVFKDLKERTHGEISQFYPVIPDKRNLEIYFDNDFWDYTDYYYTNGIRIGFIHPVFSNSPLSYLLVSNGTNGFDYYGVQIVQHMYTGTQTKIDTIIPGDRPWAAYSIIGQYATSFDWTNKIKHESEFNIGILGPKSGGGFLQDLVHTILPNNSSPEGWDNQINTDIIIDYQYRIFKSLIESKHFESYIKASAQAGTLRDNLKWGFGAKYGMFTPFYKNIQNQEFKKGNRKIYYSIFGDIETQLIGYDATLQGGVTDRTSVYTIPNRNMKRFVMQGYLGLEFTYKKLQLQLIQYWKSKEFKTGKDHKYVSVRLYWGF